MIVFLKKAQKSCMQIFLYHFVIFLTFTVDSFVRFLQRNNRKLLYKQIVIK